MKKQQIITCRLPYNVYDEFEIKCRENQINISDIIRKAVYDYLTTFEVQMNDKTTYNAKGVE
jgi:hypothetical protein